MNNAPIATPIRQLPILESLFLYACELATMNIKKASRLERFCCMFNKCIGVVVKHYELRVFISLHLLLSAPFLSPSFPVRIQVVFVVPLDL